MPESDNPEDREIFTKAFSAFDPAPASFIRTGWTIIKQTGTVAAARHTNGEVRKLPAAWFR